VTPRAKSTLIIIAILLTLLPTLYLVADRVIMLGFEDLETNDARQRIQQAADAIESNLAELDSKTIDWAARDSSYNFIAGQNEGYLESSLFPTTVLNLRVNLVVFLDSAQRIVAAKSYNETNGLPEQVPENLTEILAGNGLPGKLQPPKQTLKGILFLGSKPMLISIRPVTPNNPGALSNGYLIFGRYLDQTEMQHIAKLTNLLLEMRLLGAADLPPDIQSIQEELQRQQIITQPLDNKTFAAYSLLPDIQGIPQLILRVQLLRDVYQQGQITLRFFLFALLALGVVIGGSSQSILEKLMVTQRSSMENMGRYRAVVEQITEGMIQVDDANKVILEANPSFSTLLGYEPEVMVGMSLYQLAAQEPASLDQDFAKLLVSSQCFIGERCYRRKDGSLLDVDVSASHIHYGGRGVLVVVMRDITARKQAEKALRESEERFDLATHGANDGLWDWDMRKNEIYFSTRWKSMLGYAENEIGSSPQEWFDLVHPEDLPGMQVQIHAHLESLSGHFLSEHRMRHRDGSYRWILTRGQAVWSPDGQPYRMAGSQTDITERKHTEEQYRHDAFHDALTGLPNRALFMDRLGQSVERSKRRSDYLFALLFLDFDRFKVINDSLGHTTGDLLLINAARRLESCIRPMDTIARLGGDEFVILVEYIETPRDAVRVAERVQEALRPSYSLDGHEIFISASIGIVLSTIGYENAEDALRDADIAMYRSKANGRARFEMFNTELRSMAMARLELETDLRRAIEKEEFIVHYQPILNIESGCIRGFEALIRWNHPALGCIQPADFIPVAEETGLIIPIDLWVMREACRQMKEWQTQFPQASALTMSVNLSARQFAQPDLPDEICRILKETGLDISYLRLEITESVVMEAVESTTNMLKQLKMMGIQMEIDDFGTGYSSLSYLQQLPIDAIKIDRSFIRQMDQDSNNHGIVQAIVALAHNLGMRVIAEGVEVDDQLDRLKAMECECAQGFLFHHPMNSKSVSDLLANSQDLDAQ
jgi:diguanylate cyclase (GGDEF)-like protein/PAS domain S-box-containing protein